jgi:hypothetical protein
MPDANGRFKGIHVSAAAWERVFGWKRELHSAPCVNCNQLAEKYHLAYGWQCEDCYSTPTHR